MAMNREQKRALQKRGMSSGEDGGAVATRERRQPPPRAPKEQRTPPRQYVREVIGELRKTSWPTRKETVRLAIIVFIAIVVLTAFIFGLDVLFGEAVTRLIDTTDTPDSAAAAAAAGLLMIRAPR